MNSAPDPDSPPARSSDARRDPPAPVIPLQPAGDAQALYAKRREIYPRARIGERMGRFQKWRWTLVWLTQIVFYGLPWLDWNGRQAVLFDLAARKFYIFGLVLWPQDIIYLTALLIIAALALFLFTAIGGRLWCGYACPQTVYTDLFMWIERRIEGDRARRMALDRAPWSAAKALRKLGKHAAWIAVALWTGYTFVGFFTPIRALGLEILAFAVGGWSLFWILFYGFATYGNAGWMREQVCKYMCPYARFQSAMFDRDTLIISYDAGRGEPRGKGGRGKDRAGQGLGDCVDCGLCVQVCPTGIDIRDGLQYECIGCTACIDACDYVMERAGRPRGLVRYATEQALAQHYAGAGIRRRMLRPRVLVYGAVLVAVTGALVAALYLRVPLKVDVIRDRATLAREVFDDAGVAQIENVYRLQVMNTAETGRSFTLQASGLPGLAVASDARIDVPPASTLSVALRLRAPAEGLAAGPHKVAIDVQAVDAATLHLHETTTFLGLR